MFDFLPSIFLIAAFFLHCRPNNFTSIFFTFFPPTFLFSLCPGSVVWIAHQVLVFHYYKDCSGLFWIKVSQLDPPVCKATFFWIKAGQLDPPVCNVTFFGSKQVSWIPLSVTGQLDPFVGDVPEIQKCSCRNP